MNQDLTRGPVMRSMLLFAIPMILGDLLQQCYNVADTLIVGRFVGTDALAAVGSSYTLMTFLTSILLGLCMGSGALFSMHFGRRDGEGLRESLVSSFVLIAVVTVVLNAASFACLDLIRVFLQVPDQVWGLMRSYLAIIFTGIPAIFLYNYFASFLRAVGNSVMPLLFLIFSSCLNVGLDYWFVAGLGLGVRGASLATVLSQAVSVVLCIFYIVRRVKHLVPGKEHFSIEAGLYRELVTQGLSMGLMSSIVSAGSVILQYGINGLGTLVIAGHTAARKLFALTDMPVMAISMAAATFVSQNRGASQPQRVRQGMRQTFLFCIGTAVVMSLLMLVSARWLVGLVSGSSEPVVLDNGAAYLIWNAPFYSVLGILLATRYALQSLGQKVLPLISSGIEFVGKILFVLFFIPRFEYMAVILCEPIIWCFMCAQLLYVYIRDPFIRSASAAPEKAES